MARGLDFGSALFGTYNDTARTQLEKRRTAIAEQANVREQETHDLSIKEKQAIFDGTNEIANDVGASHDEMVQWGRQAAQRPQAQGMVAPEGMGPPSPDGTPAPAPAAAPARAAPTVNDYIDHGAKLTAKITPKIIKLLGASNPTKAAEYATQASNPELQTRMAKAAAVGAMIPVNPHDPAIPALLEAVIPGAMGSTWAPHPPDQQGEKGYGQFTQKLPDGSTREVPVNPATIKMMLTSTLSPTGILEHDLKERKETREKKEGEAAITNAQEARKLGRDTLAEHVRQYDLDLPERKARTQAALSHARAGEASAAGALEERKASRLSREQGDMVNGVLKFHGLSPAALQADTDGTLTNKVSDSLGAISAMADANKLDKNLATGTRLAAVWQQIKTGKMDVYPKDGKYFVNTGDPRNPLILPFLPEELQPKKAKGKGVTGP